MEVLHFAVNDVLFQSSIGFKYIQLECDFKNVIIAFHDIDD